MTVRTTCDFAETIVDEPPETRAHGLTSPKHRSFAAEGAARRDHSRYGMGALRGSAAIWPRFFPVICGADAAEPRGCSACSGRSAPGCPALSQRQRAETP